MPAIFDSLGVRFEYPDNWSVEPGGESGPRDEVMVSSPGTAFWQLSRHSRGTDLEPLFDEVLAALRSEYKEIEVEPDDDLIEGRHLPGFMVNFFYLDLTNTCWLRGIETPDSIYLIICQAEDREFAQVKSVFRAMMASLLRNLERGS